MERLTGLSKLADRKGFLVAYPDGLNRSWNGEYGAGRAEARRVDDVRFTANLLDTISRRFAIDERRVYATGISNGAMLTSLLACELSDRIAAIATVAGSIGVDADRRCIPSRPVAVLEVHGTEDPLVPFEGGATRGGGNVVGAVAAAQRWARRNGCATAPRLTFERDGVRCESHSECRVGTEVTLCRVHRGGHTWPGGLQYLPRAVIGETNRAVSASTMIWDFFTRHPGSGR